MLPLRLPHLDTIVGPPCAERKNSGPGRPGKEFLQLDIMVFTLATVIVLTMLAVLVEQIKK
jgi:hypothetical protein